MSTSNDLKMVQSINQSINQKRIRVTKVTNVTVRPLYKTALTYNSRLIARTHYYLTLNISETVQDIDTVTMEY